VLKGSETAERRRAKMESFLQTELKLETQFMKVKEALEKMREESGNT
jgi:hypothetical protein